MVQVVTHLCMHAFARLAHQMPVVQRLPQAFQPQGDQDADRHDADVNEKVLEAVDGSLRRMDFHKRECNPATERFR